MDFLIALDYISLTIDPNECILYFADQLARLMNANINWQFVLSGFLLESKNELTFSDRTYELHSFVCRGSDVVRSLGEEQCLITAYIGHNREQFHDHREGSCPVPAGIWQVSNGRLYLCPCFHGLID